MRGRFPYLFVDRPTEELGVGVSDRAFLRPSTIPLTSLQGNGGFQVRRQFYPIAKTPQVYAPHLVTTQGIAGTSGGIQAAGQYALQALSDFVKAKEQNGPNT